MSTSSFAVVFAVAGGYELLTTASSEAHAKLEANKANKEAGAGGHHYTIWPLQTWREVEEKQRRRQEKQEAKARKALR